VDEILRLPDGNAPRPNDHGARRSACDAPAIGGGGAQAPPGWCGAEGADTRVRIAYESRAIAGESYESR
jgi:hypothetical protein